MHQHLMLNGRMCGKVFMEAQEYLEVLRGVYIQEIPPNMSSGILDLRGIKGNLGNVIRHGYVV